MPTPSPVAIVFGTIAVMVPLFASGRVPVAIVALGAALGLHAFGRLTLFGDRTVLLIGGLFIVSAGLEAAMSRSGAATLRWQISSPPLQGCGARWTSSSVPAAP